VLRRLAHPEEAPHGQIRVLVSTVRSLIQPVAPRLGGLEPGQLEGGAAHDFEKRVKRLSVLAYERVDRVEKRGESAGRDGIVDDFPPTAGPPLPVEFWGEEGTEIRPFGVADQRSLPDAKSTDLFAPPCRELLSTD